MYTLMVVTVYHPNLESWPRYDEILVVQQGFVEMLWAFWQPIVDSFFGINLIDLVVHLLDRQEF